MHLAEEGTKYDISEKFSGLWAEGAIKIRLGITCGTQSTGPPGLLQITCAYDGLEISPEVIFE